MNKNDLKVIITPEDIYGPDWEEDIPEGWEIVAFRAPEAYETFLLEPDHNECATLHICSERYLFNHPRIILRKKKAKKIVFTFVGRRVPRAGDWYESSDGELFLCGTGFYEFDRDIYARTEIEE